MSTEQAWVVSIDTRYGMGISLWHKEEDAVDALYEYVSKHWERYFGDPEDPDTPDEDKIPEDKWEAIGWYFDRVDLDTYELELLPIN